MVLRIILMKYVKKYASTDDRIEYHFLNIRELQEFETRYLNSQLANIQYL